MKRLPILLIAIISSSLLLISCGSDSEPKSKDSDGDGVVDNVDECADTPIGEIVDLNGCSQSQIDSDEDGVADDRDNCSDTPTGESADSSGCSLSQLDSDEDGVADDKDNCPGTPAGETVDANGCLLPTDVTNPITGRTWMDRNLGASQVATSSTDAASYGYLYQWGRGSDGHQLRTSTTTSSLSSTDVPGNANFILAPDFPNDWRSPQKNNLWQGLNGTNNPCPAGYRIPSETEWNQERNSWINFNHVGAFASVLKLPMAGLREETGLLSYVGNTGAYWSTTLDGSYNRTMIFYDDDNLMVDYYRGYGCCVRCIKE